MSCGEPADEARFDIAPSTTIADLKQRALHTTRVIGDPAAYVVKFRGAEVSNESLSLEAAGIVPNAALIVLGRRRRPVR